MPVKLVGRESYFYGKSLFEIARNLRNFGEGRIVYRVKFNNKYPEPSFYRLTSVQPEMNVSTYSLGIAYGEKIFRGKNYGICKIDAGNKYDWRLIPKHEEHTYLDILKNAEEKSVKKIIKEKQKLPPLMDMIFRKELKVQKVPHTEDLLLMKLKIAHGKNNTAAIETEQEQKKNDTV